MKFYTFVRAYNREILVRGWDDMKGGHFKEKVPFKPTLFMPSKRPNEDWQTLDGQNVHPVQPQANPKLTPNRSQIDPK